MSSPGNKFMPPPPWERQAPAWRVREKHQSRAPPSRSPHFCPSTPNTPTPNTPTPNTPTPNTPTPNTNTPNTNTPNTNTPNTNTPNTNTPTPNTNPTEIAAHGHVLPHDRYVHAVLESQFAESAKLEAAVRANHFTNRAGLKLTR